MPATGDRGHLNITLGGSIPLDVASTLMRLVGAAYPSTRVSSDHRGMVFHIDHVDRVEDAAVFDRAAELKVAADEWTLDTYLRQLGDGAIEVTLPQILTATMVGLAEGMFADHGQDVNYLETTCASTTLPGQRWAVIAARSPGRTPHELRQQAETRAERLEAENARLRAELDAATAGCATHPPLPHISTP